MLSDKQINIHRGKIYRFAIVSFAVLYSLYCFVFAPLNVRFSNDVLYMYTALPVVMELLYNISEIIAISVGYAVVIYGIYRFGIKKIKGAFVIYITAAFLKYFANTVMSWIFSGVETNAVLSDILMILIYTLVESAQLAIVTFFAYRIIGNFGKKYDTAFAAAKKLHEPYPEKDSMVYPFSRLLDRKNPVLNSALAGGVVIAASKVLMRVWYDVFYTIINGLPSGAGEILLMLCYYLFDVVSGVLCYFVITFMLMKFFDMYLRYSSEENESL